MRLRKLVLVIAVLVIIAAGIGFAFHGIGPEDPAPESWQGIYRHTEFLSDIEKESISVEIKETNVRTVELEFRQTKDDASFLTVAQAELPLEQASILTFASVTGPALPEEERGTIYVELQYIDEDTIDIKYGNTQAELDKCAPVRLTR